MIDADLFGCSNVKQSEGVWRVASPRRMVNVMAGGGLQKAAGTLAAADGVAHIAFFTIFAWRAITGNGLRVVQAFLALAAMVGIASGIAGWAMIKTGSRGRARQVGMSAVALSTTLAGFLLMMASWTGD